MDDDEQARARRARARQHWPGSTTPTPAQLDTPEARIDSMWQLARDAYGPVADLPMDKNYARVFRNGKWEVYGAESEE